MNRVSGHSIGLSSGGVNSCKATDDLQTSLVLVVTLCEYSCATLLVLQLELVDIN